MLIGNHAFYECNSLTSLTIPDSVKTIGECAFEYCGSLKSVTIGKSVNFIDNCAFGYINANVTYMGQTDPLHTDDVFYGANINNVHVPKDYKGSSFCGKPIVNDVTPEEDGLSTGALIAIICAVVLVIGAGCFGVLWLIRHKTENDRAASARELV